MRELVISNKTKIETIMIDLNNINKIFITPGSTDLRIGIDGYAALVQNQFGVSPFANLHLIT